MAVHYSNRLLERTVMVLPAIAVPIVWWLLWGTADTKSMSSTFPLGWWGRGGGGGAVVTYD